MVCVTHVWQGKVRIQYQGCYLLLSMLCCLLTLVAVISKGKMECLVKEKDGDAATQQERKEEELRE